MSRLRVDGGYPVLLAHPSTRALGAGSRCFGNLPCFIELGTTELAAQLPDVRVERCYRAAPGAFEAAGVLGCDLLALYDGRALLKWVGTHHRGIEPPLHNRLVAPGLGVAWVDRQYIFDALPLARLVFRDA